MRWNSKWWWRDRVKRETGLRLYSSTCSTFHCHPCGTERAPPHWLDTHTNNSYWCSKQHKVLLDMVFEQQIYIYFCLGAVYYTWWFFFELHTVSNLSVLLLLNESFSTTASLQTVMQSNGTGSTLTSMPREGRKLTTYRDNFQLSFKAAWNSHKRREL